MSTVLLVIGYAIKLLPVLFELGSTIATEIKALKQDGSYTPAQRQAIKDKAAASTQAWRDAIKDIKTHAG